LPGASRRLLKVAEAAAKVALALLIVPMLLCLASLSQTARLTLFLFWFLSLFFDYYTTWRFYMADPDGFEDKEKSPIFKRLKARFGFKKGLLALVFLGEVPAGLLLSFIGVPAVGGAFGITLHAAPNGAPCDRKPSSEAASRRSTSMAATFKLRKPHSAGRGV